MDIGEQEHEAAGTDGSSRRFAFPLRRRSRTKRNKPVADAWIQRSMWRRRLGLVAGVGVVAVAGVAVWVMWFSPVFETDQIRVVGVSEIGQQAGNAQVVSAAAIPDRTPLIRVDTDAARDKVAQLPWVESVEVYRSWPRAIVVEVRERTPVAVVEDGEARTGVDASGVLFDPPGGLWITDPVIRGEESALPEAVKVVASLPTEIQRRVRVVQAVSPDDIRLELGNGAIVRWGNSEDGEFKAQVLLALLPRRAQAYDVSAPELPTTFGEKRDGN